MKNSNRAVVNIGFVDNGNMGIYPTYKTESASSIPYKRENQPGMFTYIDCSNGYRREKTIYIKEVIYNKPATIVFWSDGTKTVSKCVKGDRYSKEFGLTLCVLKKLGGPTKIHDMLDAWIYEDENRVTLRDVRYNSK